MGGGVGEAAEVVGGALLEFGNGGGDFADVGGFAAFAAVRDWGEEGAIGFEHELAEGCGGDGFTEFLSVFEGDNACKTDERTDGEDALHAGDVAAEAMEDAADFAGPGLELAQGRLEGVALVNDAIEFQPGGDFQLLLEDGGLFGFVALDFLGRRQTMIIEPGFANGDYFGMRREFAQDWPDVFRRGGNVRGMPTDGGVDGRESVGEGEGALAAVGVSADSDDAGDAGGVRAFDHLGEIGGEIRKVEMSVGIVE